MTKPKKKPTKATHGGPRKPGPGKTLGPPKGSKNAAKDPEDKSRKILVSARIEPEIHDRLAKEAQDRKKPISAVVADILTERYSPFPEDVA